MEVCIITLTLTLTLITTLYLWLKNRFSYWKTRNVETTSFEFFWGHGKNVFKKKERFNEMVDSMYKQLEPKDVPYFGVYMLHNPLLVVTDIDLVKSILQNDFEHFVDRGMYINEKDDPLSAHLFSLEGKKWKLMRNKLTPTFTSGKMKMMFDNLSNHSNELKKVMEKHSGAPVEIKQILNRFTLDIISSCAFGIETNSLRDPKSEFVVRTSSVFKQTQFGAVKAFVRTAVPEIAAFFKMILIGKETTKFFMNIVKDTVEYREKNNISRKDFMQLLIQLKNRGQLVDDEKLTIENITDEDNKITIEQIAAQAFVFFEAGFETSSSTMAFSLFELGQNLEIQKKAREEIKRISDKYDGKFTYEAVMEMEYLERCVNETLRKYPVASMLRRKCTKDYTVPSTNLLIEKGTKLIIPVYSIHHDAKYYPEPEKYDPDRFLEENKKNRHPFTHLPFGEGPRICIGMRFGLMQTKIGLATILRDYEITTNKRCFPLKFDPKHITLSNVNGIWIDCKKI